MADLEDRVQPSGVRVGLAAASDCGLDRGRRTCDCADVSAGGAIVRPTCARGSELAQTEQHFALFYVGDFSAISAAGIHLPAYGVGSGQAVRSVCKLRIVYGCALAQRPPHYSHPVWRALLHRSFSPLPEHLPPRDCALPDGDFDRLQFSDEPHAPHASGALVRKNVILPDAACSDSGLVTVRTQISR